MVKYHSAFAPFFRTGCKKVLLGPGSNVTFNCDGFGERFILRVMYLRQELEESRSLCERYVRSTRSSRVVSIYPESSLYIFRKAEGGCNSVSLRFSCSLIRSGMVCCGRTTQQCCKLTLSLNL